jgi:hypothetical protein
MACAKEETKSGKLLVRRDGVDVGSRPIEPCTNFWSSPDLFLQGGPSNTQAQAGVAHTIKVRVKNINANPVEDVNVEAWVCDYTAGPLPTGQVSPPGRVTGFRPGPLGPGASAVIDCAPTWTPTTAQVSINNGHLCLAGNAWAELPQPDGNELPAGGVLKVCCDTHNAQTNINLIAARRGTMAIHGMSLRAAESQEVLALTLEMRPITGRIGFGRAERQLVRSHRQFGRRKITLSRRRPRGFFFEGPKIEPGVTARFRVDSKRGKRLRIRIPVDRAEQKNSLQLFDLTTRDARTREVIGGARLLVLAL